MVKIFNSCQKGSDISSIQIRKDEFVASTEFWPFLNHSCIHEQFFMLNIKFLKVKDNYKKFVRQGRCLGHSSPVVQLDWSDDSVHIQSNSMEFEHMVWHAPTSRPVRDVDTIRDK